MKEGLDDNMPKLVCDVSQGNTHMGYIATSGKVYTFGDNSYGQLRVSNYIYRYSYDK